MFAKLENVCALFIANTFTQDFDIQKVCHQNRRYKHKQT